MTDKLKRPKKKDYKNRTIDYISDLNGYVQALETELKEMTTDYKEEAKLHGDTIHQLQEQKQFTDDWAKVRLENERLKECLGSCKRLIEDLGGHINDLDKWDSIKIHIKWADELTQNHD